MITVDEKIDLFSKIIYDKVQKENQQEIEKFNKQYGSLLELKKKEFTTEADKMFSEGNKRIDKEKSQLLSKTRVNQKKLLLEQKNKIFNEAVEGIIEYSKKYMESSSYKEEFMNNLKDSVNELESKKSLDIYVTSADLKGFKNDIINVLNNADINFIGDEEIIGGFILEDKVNNIRIDMSVLSRINESKELVGDKLFAILQ